MPNFYSSVETAANDMLYGCKSFRPHFYNQWPELDRDPKVPSVRIGSRHLKNRKINVGGLPNHDCESQGLMRK